MSAFRPTRPLAVLAIAAIALLAATVVFFRSQKECRAQPSASTKTRGAFPDALPVSVMKVQPDEFPTPVPATGTLLPRESVTIVSELSRRLVRILAKEGTRVKKGDLLFSLDASDLVAEKRRLQVQRKLAMRNAERQDDLLRSAITSEAEADAARTLEKEIEASEQVLSVTLDKTQIRAPFDGILGLRRVSEGAWVTPSTPLITISDTSQLKIDFRVPERHAAQIRVGNDFRVYVDGRNKAYSGRVIATEPSIDEASRSLLVRGLVEAEDELVPGMFAKVEIPVVRSQALLVPTIAIIPGISGRGVYVVHDGKAKLVPVELGPRTADRVQVTSGLAAGDEVIVSNLLRLRDGAAIRIEDEETVAPAP